MDLKWFDDSQVGLKDDTGFRKKLDGISQKFFGNALDRSSGCNCSVKEDALNILKFFMSQRMIPETNFKQENCDLEELNMFFVICDFYDRCLDKKKDIIDIGMDNLNALGGISMLLESFSLGIRSRYRRSILIGPIIERSKKADYTLVSEYLIEKYGFLINEKRLMREKILGGGGLIVREMMGIKFIISSNKIRILNENGNSILLDSFYMTIKNYVLKNFQMLEVLEREERRKMPPNIFTSMEDVKEFFTNYEKNEFSLYFNEISSGTNLINDPIRYCKILYFLLELADDKEKAKRCVADAVLAIRERVINQDKLLIVEFIENLKNGRTDINSPNYDYLRNIVMVHGSKGSINFIKKYERENRLQYVNQNISLSDSNFIELLEERIQNNAR